MYRGFALSAIILLLTITTAAAVSGAEVYSEAFTPGKIVDVPSGSTFIVISNVSLAYKGVDGYPALQPSRMIPYEEEDAVMYFFSLRGVLPGSMDIIGPDGAMRLNVFDAEERERKYVITAELESVKKERAALAGDVEDLRRQLILSENTSSGQLITIAQLEEVIAKNYTRHDLMRQEDAEKMMEVQRLAYVEEAKQREGHPVVNFIKHVLTTVFVIVVLALVGFWVKSQGRH